MRRLTLPIEPLEAAVGPIVTRVPRGEPTRRHDAGSGAFDQPGGGRPRIAELARVSRRTVDRWAAAGGVPLEVADRVAVALGFHPAQIWTEWYTLPNELDELEAAVDELEQQLDEVELELVRLTLDELP